MRGHLATLFSGHHHAILRLARMVLLAFAGAALLPLLAQTPDPDEQIHEAYRLAWAGRYDRAIDAFETLLAIAPDNREARNGLAYTLAWSGRYRQANASFNAILADHPGQEDARKGLAYVALWSGDAGTAARRFAALHQAAPDNTEYRFQLAQAHAAEGRLAAARAGFRQTLAVDPGHSDARRALQQLNERPAFLEARVEAGYSDLSSETAVGARQLEVALSPDPRQRYWLRYDDALSLDNPVLRSSDTRIPAYFAGAQTGVGNDLLVKAEVGWRDLSSGKDLLVLGEGVWFMRPGTHLKAGGIIADGRDRAADRGFLLGMGQQIGARIDVSPTVYGTWSGPSGDSEWRAVLGASYRIPGRLHVNGSAGIGALESAAAGGDIAIGHLQIAVPVFGRHWIHLLARRESLPGGGLTVIAAGLTLRLERR